jgi:parallel beta-helix repeat protein
MYGCDIMNPNRENTSSNGYRKRTLAITLVLFMVAMSVVPMVTVAEDTPTGTMWDDSPESSISSEECIGAHEVETMQKNIQESPLAPPTPRPWQVLTYYTDRTIFNTACPGLPTENFEASNVPPGGITADDGPFNDATNNACYSPGALMSGFSIDCIPNTDQMVVLAPGALGNPSTIVGPNTFVDDTDITFPGNNVNSVGMDLLAPLTGGVSVDIEIYGIGGVLMDTTTATTGTTTGQFWGVQCNEIITQIIIRQPGGEGELLDDLTFGLSAFGLNNILVYADDYFHPAPNTYIDQALNDMGLAYTAYYDGNFGTFEADLVGGGPWDLVIFGSENYFVPTSTYDLLNTYATSGGRLICQAWDVSYNLGHPLWNTLGFTWVSDDNSPPDPVYWWQPGHQFFNIPHSVPEFTVLGDPGYGIYGQHVNPLGGFDPLAGYTTPGPDPNEAALIYGNGGLTVYKAWLDGQNDADQEPDGMLDGVELWINMILSGGAPPSPYSVLLQPPFQHDICTFVGEEVDYPLTVMNTGSVDDAYDLSASGNAWPVTFFEAPVPYLSEDFEAAFPPPGWTVIDPDATGGWHQSGFDANGMPPPDGTLGAYVEYVIGYASDEWLVSPPIDLSTSIGTHISYDWNWWSDYGGATSNGYVLGSTDGGTTWTQTIYTFPNGDPWTTGTHTWDISGWADGQANVAFAFNYVSDTDDWCWMIDNVEVITTAPSTPITSTPTITPGGTYDFIARVTVPGGAGPGDYDFADITASSQPLFGEQFEGAFPPAGWTVIDNEGTGVDWDRNDAWGEGNYITGGGTYCACTSSDNHGVDEFDTELWIPSLDFSTETGPITLSYDVNYQNYGFRDFLDVDVSTDGGGSWTTHLSWNEDHGGFRGPPSEHVNIDLSTYAGLPSVIVRWHYYDPLTNDFDWYAEIDNVAISNRAPATNTAQILTIWPYDTPWFDDMESGPGVWLEENTGNTMWELGNPAGGVGPTSAFSPTDCWGTNLLTDYELPSEAMLYTPPITVGPGSQVLKFAHWYEIDGYEISGDFEDGGWVEVSTDGGATWTQLFPVGGYNDVTGDTPPGYPGLVDCYAGISHIWLPAEFDVSAYSGQICTFRFRFFTEQWVESGYPGWYVDNIYVGPWTYGVDVTPDYQWDIDYWTATIDYPMTVTNTGTLLDTYDLSVVGNTWPTSLWDITGTMPIVTSGALAPGGSMDFIARVTIPFGVADGSFDVAAIMATSQADPIITWDAGAVETIAMNPYGVDLTPNYQTDSGYWTEDVEYFLTVTNTGVWPDTYDLLVAGNAWPTTIWNLAGTVQIFDTGVIPPGGSLDFIARVTIPWGLADGSSDYAIITALSQNDPFWTWDDADIETFAMNPFGVDLAPEYQTGSGYWTEDVDYVLTVTNTGVWPDTYDLSVVGNAWPTTFWNLAGGIEILDTGVIPPGGTFDFITRVTVPWGVMDGSSDYATIWATSQNDPVWTLDDADVETYAMNPFGVDLVPDYQNQWSNTGTYVDYVMIINNIGVWDDTYDLSVVGDAWPVTFWDITGTTQIWSIFVPAGGSELFIARVAIPLGPGPGSSDAATIWATSQNDPVWTMDDADIDTDADPRYWFTTTPNTQTRFGWKGDYVDHIITVNNQGTEPDCYLPMFGPFQWRVEFFEIGEEEPTWWVGPCAPGGTHSFIARVRVPNVQPGDMDQVPITITSANDRNFQQTVQIITLTSLPTPYYNNFESGVFGQGVTNVDWTVNNPAGADVDTWTSYSGSNSMWICGQGTIITSGWIYTTLTNPCVVSYWVQRGGPFSEAPDTGEDLVVEYYSKQGQWVELDRFPGDGIQGAEYYPVHKLPPNGLHPRFHLRFRQLGGALGEDYWHIDDVYVGSPDPKFSFLPSGPIMDYQMSHSTDPGGPTFSPIPIAGTPIVLSDDSVSGLIPIGFNFPFYDNSYNNLYVSSNGFLTFELCDNGCCYGRVIPTNDGWNNLIAFWWEDLYPPGGGTITYDTVGSAPNRIFVLEFDNIQHWPSGHPCTMQTHLYESSGVIDIHYTSALSDGGTHTVGVENADGTVATAYLNSVMDPPAEVGTALRFTPEAPDPTLYGWTGPGSPIIYDMAIQNNAVPPGYHSDYYQVNVQGNWPASVQYFQDNFNDGDYNGWVVVDEGTTSPPSNWWIDSGTLRQSSNIHIPHPGCGQAFPGTYIWSGDTSWRDYTFESRFRSTDNDVIGFIGRYQDTDNYYRFHWTNQGWDQDFTTPGVQYWAFDKKVNGVWSVVTSGGGPYIQNHWYDLEMTFLENRIQTNIDGQLFFDVTDNSLSSGAVGFFCWAHQADFDDVFVYPPAGPGGSDYIIGPVPPGQSMPFTVTVVPPMGTMPGDYCINTVTAHSIFTNQPTHSSTLWTTIGSVHNLDLDTWHPTIQEGVDMANPGNHIFTYSGEYNENVVIDKPLIIEGENRDTTIINGGEQGSGGPPDVLIAYADDGGGEPLRSQLLALGGLGTLDVFDAQSATPSLAQLQAYDVVITWSNYPYFDRIAMGDVLADYLDSDGNVICGEFVHYDTTYYGLGGRFVNDGYDPLYSENLGYPGIWANLGVYDPNHPIMQGVTSAGDDYRDLVGLSPGATLIASWDDGEEFVATKRNAVSINSYPGIYNHWTGDVDMIFHNSIFWLVGNLAVVNIVSDYVTFSGFTVQNGPIGILLNSGTGCDIFGNRVQGCGDGVVLDGSGANHVHDNEIQDNTGGEVTGNLLTMFANNNDWDGNMFDLTAHTDITITGFDCNIGGTGIETIEVYYKPGTYVGFESTPGAWTFLGTADVVAQDSDNPTPVPIGGLTIPAGQTYGIYVTTLSGIILYTNGDNTYDDGNLRFQSGCGIGYPFGGTASPRTWNGRIYYTAADGNGAGIEVRGTHTFTDDFSTDTGMWTYYGSATLTGGYCSLTGTTDYQVGQILYNAEINTPFVAEFDYLAGGGDGADGMAMNFFKESYVPQWGGSLGAVDADGTTLGYAVEFDNYQNGGEPSANHIAITQNSAYNHLALVNDPRTEDNAWHHVRVEVTYTSISVYVDGPMVLGMILASGTLDMTYGGFSFSGATGGLNNNHRVDNVQIWAGNMIYSNDVEDNDIGFLLQDAVDNRIVRNNIIDNGIQAIEPVANNYWDDGYPAGGNYWSDHTGPDAFSGPLQNIPGGDGIVDTPYIIGAGSQDNYPLAAPWTILSAPPIIAYTVICGNPTNEQYVGQSREYTVTVRNTGTTYDIYDLSVLANTWDATFWDQWMNSQITTLGPVAPGDLASFIVRVDVPAAALNGAADSVEISITSQCDDSQVEFLTFVTTAVVDLPTPESDEVVDEPVVEEEIAPEEIVDDVGESTEIVEEASADESVKEESVIPTSEEPVEEIADDTVDTATPTEQRNIGWSWLLFPAFFIIVIVPTSYRLKRKRD